MGLWFAGRLGVSAGRMTSEVRVPPPDSGEPKTLPYVRIRSQSWYRA